MPELPEVETVRRQLDEHIRGLRILSVERLRSGREFPSGSAFEKRVVGRTVLRVDRRAKLLIWKFDDGTAMIAHLKMTGRFVFVEDGYAPQKHDRMIFFLNGQKLVWSDVRRFGFVKMVSSQELEEILSAYGPEPLEVSSDVLALRLVTPKTRAAKAALLNQEVIAGIGNIYADESLHRAGIRPTRRLGDLTDDDRQYLAQEIQQVLRESLAQQGTSANDYVDTRGEKVDFSISCGCMDAKVSHV